MSALQFRLLGTLAIQLRDRALPRPPTLKSQSLLAYLVCHRDRPQPRDRLVALFWGDRPERKARRSLTTALWHIRHRCLPDPELILSDTHTVQFQPQADLWVDVEAFTARAAQDDLDDLQAAVALYRGDFLEGFYDDWVINERYRLESLFLDVLARLMAGHEALDDPRAALATAQRLLEHDPLQEEAHRVAMRAYCRLGQRNAALEQYHRCRQVVQAELGTEPMAETTELYRAIRAGRLVVAQDAQSQGAPVPPRSPKPPGRTPLDARAFPLVGRERDLAFLEGCWRRAQAGQESLLLVQGPAGVGKTRLVEAFAGQVRWEGARVLWGRCYEFERLLPYQPIAEALRATLPDLTSAELDRFPGWCVAQVAQLVPEMAEKYPRPLVLSSVREDQEQAHLFDGVARFLALLTAHTPCLLVLEDLHWASESTLQLVYHLARRLRDDPILLVGTLRPEETPPRHPLRDLEQQLDRMDLVRVWHLTPLSAEAVTALVTEMSGAGDAVLPLARRLYAETEGNPFFVMEMVKVLFALGLVHLEEGTWQGDFSRISQVDLPLPKGLGAAIQARMRRLSEETQEALRVAAILGREFDFELLHAVWQRSEETTLQALDEMLRHRFIDEGTGAMGRDYAFTHHKIQEAIYADISQRQRQHLHARVAMAMERLYHAHREEVSGELAFHFLEGQRLDPSLTEKAITYLIQAGDHARGLYAHQEAVRFYRQALTLLEEQGMHERAARVLMKLGLAHHLAFDFRRARQAYHKGFVLWQRAAEAQIQAPGSPRPAPHALRVNWSEPLTLDPALADDVVSASVIEQLFSGLVELSPEMDVVPDVARTWEVLEGGRRYVFHLREDVRWSDGVPVTAGDFEYAWKRLLHRDTGSPIAHRLFDVRGARAFHQGDLADPAGVGIHAVDECTLVVELERPTSYFTHLLTIPAAYPVPRHRVEAHGATWTQPAHMATNGPFQLETWERGASILLSRNPHYHGRFQGNVHQVALLFIPDPWSELEAYEEDDLDILDLWGLPAGAMDRVRREHAQEYSSLPVPRTHYIGFDVSRPPFADLRVRRAFVMATDRRALAETAMRGYRSPATGGFVPPGMPGHSPEIGLDYDPDRARALLAQAGYPDGQGFPQVEALDSLTGGRALTVEYLETQWRQNLGIQVTWQTTGYRELRGRLATRPPHLFMLSWGAAYPDPDFFLRVGPVRHDSRWQNRTYDDLVEQAREVTDQGTRMALYGQADRLLVEEAVILPLTYGRIHLLVKPWVRWLPASTVKQWFWKDVVMEPHASSAPRG